MTSEHHRAIDSKRSKEISEDSTASESTNNGELFSGGKMGMPLVSPSSTIIRKDMPTIKVPIHPGEILSEEFLRPAGITQERFAKALGVSRRTVNEIVRGRRSVTAEMALRLSKVLGTSAELWLGLQTDYDLLTAPKVKGLRRIRLTAASDDTKDVA